MTYKLITFMSGKFIVEKISRKEAKQQGLKYYYTGTPCPRGHVGKRFTSIGTCMECGKERAMEKHVHTTNRRRTYNDLPSFISAAIDIHKNKYSYEKAQYSGSHSKLLITCPRHGQFEQNPTNHVQGKGCPQCKNERVGLLSRSTKPNFVTAATEFWGEKYDYSKVIYNDAKAKVVITCVDHGDFEQTPTNHLSGKEGCTRCNHMQSRGEMEVLKFLSIFTTTEHRNRILLKPKELDVLVPEHGLAIEYCGEYHHGTKDPEHEKATKRNHKNKHKDCAAKDIRLITMFELEWKSRNKQIRRLLRAAIGKLKGRVFARKCEIRSVPIIDARQFFEKYHIQGGAGSGEHYGLYWNEKLVACMRFTFGGNDRGAGAQNRKWTLSRYATRINVVAGASRLFHAFVREHQPQEVKSFSDNRYYSGGMYEKLGFIRDAELPEDYQVWSQKLGVLPKSHYQRRMIPKRLAEHGIKDAFDPDTDSRTEAEMTYLMGCRRLYDCGKIRWVWNAD